MKYRASSPCRRHLPVARACLLAGCLALPSLAAAKESPQNAVAAGNPGPAEMLSPMEVTAQTMAFNHWLRFSSPHFIVYTDATAKECALIVKHLEMVHQAAQYFFRRKGLNLPAMIVVLPTERSDWRKIANRGQVKWEVACTLGGSARRLLLVQYDWQEQDLASVFAMVGNNELDNMNLRGPIWFSRGVSAFFRTVTFDGDMLTIGRQGTDAFWIHEKGWLAWPRFFRVSWNSPEYTQDTDDHNRWEGQCGVFTHYLLTSPDKADTERLLAWAAYLNAGNQPSEQSFKDLFHTDWKGWQDKIEKMLDGGKYATGNIRFPPSALQFTVATDQPSRRELRELFLLSQIENQDTADSVSALNGLLQRGLETEALREVLADACGRRDHRDAALEQLRTIIAAGSSNPVVYSDAACREFWHHVPKLTIESRLGDEADEIRQWCNRACELEPLLLEANEALAWTEALAPTVEARNLEAIAAICHRLDGNAPTDNALAALAVARLRSGKVKSARGLAQQIKTSPYSDQQAKGIAEQILAVPEPPADSAAPAPSPAAPPQPPSGQP